MSAAERQRESAIRAIRRALQRGHLVVDSPDDRPFARMRRFRPPGVARLGLVI